MTYNTYNCALFSLTINQTGFLGTDFAWFPPDHSTAIGSSGWMLWKASSSLSQTSSFNFSRYQAFLCLTINQLSIIWSLSNSPQTF